MRGKNTIIILTDNSSRNTSAAIKEAIRDNKDVLVIIIAENELEGYLRNSLFNFLFKEESKIRGYYDRFKEFRKATKMNKLASQKVSFNIKSPVHRRVQNVFLRYTPDIVIAMTPKVLAPSLAVRDKLRMKTKIVAVIDEFSLDKQMVHRAVDYYFVDNDNIKKELIEHGVSEQVVQVNYIPIRSHIKKEITREEALKMFDFEDRLTILIVASQFGDERFKKVVAALYDKRYDANVIVACGYNRRMLAYVREKTNFLGLNEGININAGYSCADIIIARPTATVLMEAIYKKKLIFAIHPSGEMEKRAINFLNQHLLIKAENETELMEQLDKFMEDNDSYIGIEEEVKMFVEQEPTELLVNKLYELMPDNESQVKE